MLSIAVIIPVGPGHENHARRAVLSVRRQSVPAMPIIANDTAATYIATGHAVQTATGNGGRQGVGTARALGTSLADDLGYDMVCYLDADDILMPRALEAMLRTYAARPASYVYGDGYNLRGGKATYYRAPEYDRAIYGRQNIHNVTALMPTSVALAGEWTNRHWEDYLFYCSLALRGLCGVRAPYPVIAYDMAAGYRREMATNEGAGYANGLAAEYQTKFLANGGPTMGCCGSSGPLSTSAAAMVEAAPGVAQPDGTVAMAYSGNAAAGVPYNVNGRQYTGKVGSVIYAHKDDVARLEQIGVFYQVPATPDGEETIKLAEEYNALVLGPPPGAEVAQMLADASNASADAVNDLAHGMAEGDSQSKYATREQIAVWMDGRRREQDAALNRVLEGNPALANLPPDELARYADTMQRHMDANPEIDYDNAAEVRRLFADADPLTVDAAGNVLAQVDTAQRAHKIDGGENGVLGSPPPPKLPDNDDDGDPDASDAAAPPVDTTPAEVANSAEDDDDGDPDGDKPKAKRGRKPKVDQK